MSKLFALEEMENQDVGVELEATPEVGEVADVQVDVEEDVGETEEAAAAIDEGMGAADQLEEVQEVVADAAEGEGLDPVAAEAIRIAVEAICARVGANPKAVYSLYATENFQSASLRKANTKIALEGVGEFLKDMWKKIKAALTRLWEKTKAFWDKHVSSLGRIKKALESAKKNVASSTGKLKDKAYIEDAPSALSDALGGGDISAKSFGAFITAHKAALDAAGDITTKTTAFNTAAGSTIASDKASITKATDSLKAADKKTGTLVGNITIDYKFVPEGEGEVTLEIERETLDKKDKGGVSLAEKNEVKGVLDGVLNIINDNIKAKEKQNKLQESFNKLALAIEKAINGAPEGDQKELRDAMKVVYKINAKAPSVQNELLGLNIKLAKAALMYAGICVKNYK